MTERNKKLLLDDLAKRLGNDVKMGDNRGHIGTLKIIDHIHNTIGFKTTNMYGEDSVLIKGRIDFWKPYLRPMQSMTKVEKEEYRKLCKKVVRKLYVADGKSWSSNKTSYRYFGTKTEYYDTYQSIDYLISRHFDYRGLIGKKLALKATKGMYEF